MVDGTDYSTPRYVSGRKEVVEAAIEIIDEADEECLGMGRKLRWVRQSGFKTKVREATDRGVSIRVIGVQRGSADEFAEKFEPTEVDVKYSEHGDVRMAMADTERALIGIPSSISFGDDEPEYEAVIIENEALCEALHRRFEKYWAEASDPVDPVWATMYDEFRREPSKYVGHLISGLFGAFLTLLAAQAI